MNKREIEDLTISIITRLHERYDKKGIDDVEYIPLLKSVINGALDFAEEAELSDNQQTKIKETLFDYARDLYLNGWLMNGEPDEDKEQAAEEGMNWFGYIYENEKYPR